MCLVYAAANDGMVIPGRVVARAREMVREGGRLLRSIILPTESLVLNLFDERTNGWGGDSLQHPSQNEFLIID